MKYLQLADGQQFEYQGDIYTKKGPMMAVDRSGASKLIPRSAVVTPVSNAVPASATDRPSGKIAIQDMLALFEAFYASCHALLDESEKPKQQQLATAKDKFLSELSDLVQ